MIKEFGVDEAEFWLCCSRFHTNLLLFEAAAAKWWILYTHTQLEVPAWKIHTKPVYFQRERQTKSFSSAVDETPHPPPGENDPPLQEKMIYRDAQSHNWDVNLKVDTSAKPQWEKVSIWLELKWSNIRNTLRQKRFQIKTPNETLRRKIYMSDFN